jgi:hypothetical protein
MIATADQHHELFYRENMNSTDDIFNNTGKNEDINCMNLSPVNKAADTVSIFNESFFLMFLSASCTF